MGSSAKFEFLVLKVLAYSVTGPTIEACSVTDTVTSRPSCVNL